jgi:hypothetical protein
MMRARFPPPGFVEEARFPIPRRSSETVSPAMISSLKLTIFYVGHGPQVKNLDGDKGDWFDEGTVFDDGHILDDDLRNCWSRMRPRKHELRS